LPPKTQLLDGRSIGRVDGFGRNVAAFAAMSPVADASS
jgi:hypothetical protein